MNADLKARVAQKALEYLDDYSIIGVGTGSTIHYFIEALATIKHRIEACVASSLATEALLRAHAIPVLDLNAVSEPLIYIDGADEINARHEMIKGGGGALTREKIIASVAQKFVCIVDSSKVVNSLGTFPIAVEVLPMARSFVARALVKLGGDPHYRQGFITDNGNIILDVHHLDLTNVHAMESAINQITGVVENGLFAARLADVVLVSSRDGVTQEI